MYAELLRTRFPRLRPTVDDLLLLERHQIAELPVRAPAAALAAVLHADARLHRFLVARCPPIGAFLERLLADHGPVAADRLPACAEHLVWEIADWIVYQRAASSYDASDTTRPADDAVAGVVDVAGKTVVDAGAGTGALTFALAPEARTVFAVEPVAGLRDYMRDDCRRAGVENVYVIDGFLHAIPLPSGSVDVLVTRRSIGWRLPEEIAEIERVLGPKGGAVHLLGLLVDADNDIVRTLVSSGYTADTYREGAEEATRCWRRKED